MPTRDYYIKTNETDKAKVVQAFKETIVKLAKLLIRDQNATGYN